MKSITLENGLKMAAHEAEGETFYTLKLDC